MDISDRIEALITRLGLSKTAFAESLGTSSSRISNITTKRNKPDSELLETILTVYKNVNAHWLLTGKGEMLQAKISNDQILEFEGDKERFTAMMDAAIIRTLLEIAWDKIPDKSIRNLKRVLSGNFKEIDVIRRAILSKTVTEKAVDQLLGNFLDQFLESKGLVDK